MPEKVTFNEDLEIIQVESWGDITLVDLKGSLEAVLKLRQKRGITRVFVDASREKSFPSTMPALHFGENLSKTEGDVKIAVVANPRVRDRIDFLETVVFNRGGQMRTFESSEDAMVWLLKEPNKPDALEDN